MPFHPEVEDWSRRHFGKAALGDKRRVRRVEQIASSLATHPGASIPRACGTTYDVKAAYNLFQHPQATPENLQAGHRELVLDALHEGGTILLLEDTSELAWETGRRIDGLGPVGKGKKWDQGFLLHTVLAVRWAKEAASPLPTKRPPVEVIGIASQQYYIRQPIPAGENGNGSQHRMGRDRESRLWSEAGKQLGHSPTGASWVRVCDRGADIYEFLQACGQLGHGFVVRAAQDRGLVGGGRLFEKARQAAVLGQFSLERRARYKHPARVAHLVISACPVSLRAPQRPGASVGKLAPIVCHVVHIWEPEPPEGEEALEWFLLVDRPISTFEQALEVTLQYATRWVIEDFHQALKTGLGAERLQLEEAHRLFAAVAVMSVVALRLLDIRERLRVQPNAPATEAGLDPFELQVLARHLNRKLTSVDQVVLAIGRLGGHMNRKADGHPGLITLWRGMLELQALVAGARLGLQFRDLGKG